MMQGEHFQHLAKVAQILEELSVEIEELGARLCCDPALVAAHISDLQSIDLIAQQQRWIADLVRSECPVFAVESIGVEALQRRLRAGSQ